MNLRLATINDAELLLNWRNDELTRANSFNDKVISIQDHLEWFHKSLASRLRKIYIAEINNIPIGTIRVDINDDNSRELSWIIAPSQRGYGYGTKILSTFVSMYPSVYIAQIKEKNTPSIKMVTSCGFTLLSDKRNILKFIKKPSDLEIIDAIQKIRNKNNVNWMDILRIAFKYAPSETREVFKRITDSDDNIGNLSKLLANND